MTASIQRVIRDITGAVSLGKGAEGLLGVLAPGGIVSHTQQKALFFRQGVIHNPFLTPPPPSTRIVSLLSEGNTSQSSDAPLDMGTITMGTQGLNGHT